MARTREIKICVDRDGFFSVTRPCAFLPVMMFPLNTILIIPYRRGIRQKSGIQGGASAFENDKVLASVPTFTKLTTIGAGAFAKCKALTKITLGSVVQSVGKNAFLNCTKLNNIILKTKLLITKKGKIGASAFKGLAVKPAVTCPKGTKKAYQTLLKKKGLTKKATFVEK